MVPLSSSVSTVKVSACFVCVVAAVCSLDIERRCARTSRSETVVMFSLDLTTNTTRTISSSRFIFTCSFAAGNARYDSARAVHLPGRAQRPAVMTTI
ncbi:hypothetical protein PF007_g30362 [Phytophthora fragariae]|uniref:Secreted protein n=1 Tax=Phytophthora fragariae TaxID=53985 RepID=A0A6A3PTH9_9STRA|nr:hypothetical protein PF003_g14338 [Phytophthora fragariae]KAE8918899.1 hypothetical protein PF009_g30789 [Phytophthora fragariae]KAE9061132.1 hypothetical protein PF007_g30362 [Phytophthora fragariae]KAE9065783.1 hypothetical protein PF006_g30379 [Phytophthora fragariae]KAE9266856.1 hypothetical protein PF001_g30310 [Phytophthora fragariae]